MITPALNTLGFPDWSLAQVTEFARQNNIAYIEIRGLENELELLALPGFHTPEGIAAARAMLDSAPPIQVLSLNLGTQLGSDISAQAQAIQDIAALADQLGARYLRFFAGGAMGTPPDLARIAAGARRVYDLLAPYRVQMIVETHDSLVRSADILALNDLIGGRLNLLWDIAHPFRYGGESWEQTWAQVGPLVRYLHVKDIHTDPATGKTQNCRFLEGDLPARELLTYLHAQPEEIVASFEWEKRWDPALEPGDIAMRDFLQKLHKLLGE